MVISIGAKMVPDCCYPNAMIDGISGGDASVDAAPLLHYISLSTSHLTLTAFLETTYLRTKLITIVNHCMQRATFVVSKL